MLLLGRSADEAFGPLAPLRPFMPFRDASCGTPCFHLQVQVSEWPCALVPVCWLLALG